MKKVTVFKELYSHGINFSTLCQHHPNEKDWILHHTFTICNIYMLHIGNPGVNNEVGFLSHVSHYNSHHVLIPTDHFSSAAANPLYLSMSSMWTLHLSFQWITIYLLYTKHDSGTNNESRYVNLPDAKEELYKTFMTLLLSKSIKFQKKLEEKRKFDLKKHNCPF